MKMIALALPALMLVSPAMADRAPTPDERSEIEAKLRAEGFTTWEGIELEDDGSVWEVDDAVGADGREYDLELRAGTLEVLKRDPD